jgi:hypothetical protein
LDEEGSHFVYWKGSKSSNPRRVGDNSISFQVNILDRNQANWDAKNSDYIGFAILSRTECGQPLIRDMDNGNIKIGVFQQDTTAIYQNVYSYLRWDGDKDRRSFTIQFSRLLNGGSDGKANSKKDLIWMTMYGFSDEVMATLKDDEAMDACLNKINVGVLPLLDGVESDYDHARCVGEQKLVGF